METVKPPGTNLAIYYIEDEVLRPNPESCWLYNYTSKTNGICWGVASSIEKIMSQIPSYLYK